LVEVDVSKIEYHLPEEQMEIGEPARKALQEIPATKQKLPLMLMKKFLKTVVTYLQKSFQLTMSFFKILIAYNLLNKRKKGALAVSEE
jgi:hypothetical protein